MLRVQGFFSAVSINQDGQFLGLLTFYYHASVKEVNSFA